MTELAPFEQPSNAPWGQDLGLLLLRIAPNAMMMGFHGWSKWFSYAEKSAIFPDPLHVGSPLSLSMAIFAELACAGAIMLGLGTRLASLVLAFNFGVIVWLVHGADPLPDKELPLFYLAVYLVLALVGPGRFSLDAILKRHWRKKSP